MKEYKIMGKYKGQAWEVVDTATSKKEANYLLNEYRIAFGSDFTLKIK